MLRKYKHPVIQDIFQTYNINTRTKLLYRFQIHKKTPTFTWNFKCFNILVIFVYYYIISNKYIIKKIYKKFL